jgi:phosphate:Na+ symporter
MRRPSRSLYLDEAARETPVVAIGAAAREALRLADMLEAMLHAARDAFATDDRKRSQTLGAWMTCWMAEPSAIKTYLPASTLRRLQATSVASRKSSPSPGT